MPVPLPDEEEDELVASVVVTAGVNVLMVNVLPEAFVELATCDELTIVASDAVVTVEVPPNALVRLVA